MVIKMRGGNLRLCIVLAILFIFLACDGQSPLTSLPVAPHAPTSGIIRITPTSPVRTPTTQRTDTPSISSTEGIIQGETEYVYVTNAGSGSVSVVDSTAHRVVSTITGRGLHSPVDIVLGPNGDLYVANFYSPTMAIIDPRTNTVISAIRLDRDELASTAASAKAVYVTSNDGGVFFITLEQDRSIAYVPVPGLNPSAVIADEQRVYVAYTSLEDTGSHIAILDADSGTLLLDVRISGVLDPTGPSYLRGLGSVRGLALASPGHLFCVTDSLNAAGNRFLVIDAVNGTIVHDWNVSLQPDYYAFALDKRLAITPQGKVYIANSGSDSILVFEPETGRVIRTIPVGHQPVSVAVGTMNRAYVTNYGGHTISVINTITDQVVGDPIHVGLNPTGVATYRPQD